MSRVHEPTIGDQTRELYAAIRQLGLTVHDVATPRDLIGVLIGYRADLIDSLNGPDVAPTATMLRIRTLTRDEIRVCERALRAAGVPLELDDAPPGGSSDEEDKP